MFCDPKDELIFQAIHKKNQKISFLKLKGNDIIVKTYKKINENASLKPSPTWFDD